MTFTFDNTYAKLPTSFYAQVAPTKVKAPRVVKINRPLAELLGLDADVLASPEGAELLSGNTVPEGAASIALAYAGHQFGNFVPQLGDGRAILLGEIVGTDGKRRDLQLKGSGRTPFSRGGDGRAALGPVLREYVVSEAMAALGVPTTRALAAVLTGDRVVRDEVQPGAVLTRVAASHIRVGTFEYFATRGDHKAIAALATYALQRHYPDKANTGNDALALLECVLHAQSSLVARWLGVGFVHGVMNTDNSSISGETIDYGPCAFLDEYDPKKKFSSIDRGGRYAFANQPRIAQWNLVKLAEALLPAMGDDEDEAARLATEQLNRFPALFEAAHARVLRAKLGLVREDASDPRARRRSARADGHERGGPHAVLSPSLRVRARHVCGRIDGLAICQCRGVSRLGRSLAPAPRRGGDDAGSARERHAAREPGAHPAEPSHRGDDRGGRHSERLRAVREAREGARAPLRRPSRIRIPERAADARGARDGDVLRDLSPKLSQT
ncbi:MAG: YdiU family protein [Rhizomicrobium sp.]